MWYVCVRLVREAGVVKNLGWLFILFPVLFDCVVIIAMGACPRSPTSPDSRAIVPACLLTCGYCCLSTHFFVC